MADAAVVNIVRAEAMVVAVLLAVVVAMVVETVEVEAMAVADVAMAEEVVVNCAYSIIPSRTASRFQNLPHLSNN